MNACYEQRVEVSQEDSPPVPAAVVRHEIPFLEANPNTDKTRQGSALVRACLCSRSRSGEAPASSAYYPKDSRSAERNEKSDRIRGRFANADAHLPGEWRLTQDFLSFGILRPFRPSNFWIKDYRFVKKRNLSLWTSAASVIRGDLNAAPTHQFSFTPAPIGKARVVHSPDLNRFEESNAIFQLGSKKHFPKT